MLAVLASPFTHPIECFSEFGNLFFQELRRMSSAFGCNQALCLIKDSHGAILSVYPELCNFQFVRIWKIPNPSIATIAQLK